MKRYSRRIAIEYVGELQPGDLVDLSTNLHPYWATMASIGECADDINRDVECDGECRVVLFFADADQPPWHVGDSDEVNARLPAVDGQHVVDAENETHDLNVG
jgi:hypothetical protein